MQTTVFPVSSALLLPRSFANTSRRRGTRVLETAQRRTSHSVCSVVAGPGVAGSDATAINPRIDFLSGNILAYGEHADGEAARGDCWSGIWWT